MSAVELVGWLVVVVVMVVTTVSAMYLQMYPVVVTSFRTDGRWVCWLDGSEQEAERTGILLRRVELGISGAPQ